MITIITLIGAIAILGMVVWYVTTLPMPALFKNLIYLVVGIVIILFIVHTAQLGHLPTLTL